MNAEFFDAVADIEKEKGIPREYMYEKIRQAMLTAFRKDTPDCEDNVEVILDETKKKIEMVVKKTVVERVIDPYVEISEEAAHRISKRAKVGDIVSVPVETKQFGRIAAQAAKQVIIQGIREAERGMIYEEFNSKEHEILTGVVNKIDPRTGCAFLKISSNSDYTEAMLAPAECIRGEVLHEGDRIKVYVVEVRNSTRGPQVLISRTHPGLVKRLFELEVPEIFDGTVEIKSIAREAGSRTKMAVWAEDPVIDPIGACVGPKGGRVASVVNELGGEKIDIVKYSEVPEEFIAAALAPSEVLEVTLLDEGKTVVFLTLGDPTIYSTYWYVHKRVAARGHDAELVPGVPSFCAAAATMGRALCEDGEMLHIIPATHGRTEEGLSLSGSRVLMKTGKSVLEVRELLRQRGELGSAAFLLPQISRSSV